MPAVPADFLSRRPETAEAAKTRCFYTTLLSWTLRPVLWGRVRRASANGRGSLTISLGQSPDLAEPVGGGQGLPKRRAREVTRSEVRSAIYRQGS